MKQRKPGRLQALILEATPNPRPQIAAFCRNLGYHSSAVYRAINTLQRRGVILLDDDGTLRMNDGNSSPTA